MEKIPSSSTPESLQPKERFQVTPIAYMILRRSNNILLLKRKKTGMYSLPAGHMEESERSLNAAVRETGEETGVTIKPEDARFVHIGHFKHPDGQVVAFFYESESFKGEPQVMEPDIHEEVRWVPFNNLPENLAPYVRLALQNIAQGKPYTEYGWQE